MEDLLRVYLHDHLAGSGFAIELLETLVKSYPDHETGILAGDILKRVREDRATLEQIIERVGRSSIDLKDASMWLAEKVSRAKLRHDHPAGLGAFEAIEALSLGILGKLALWRAMPFIAEADTRVAGYDYEGLAARAKSQFDRVEAYRLSLAKQAFSSVTQ